MDDLMEEMYAEFPDIAPSSIYKICKTGMMRIRKHINSGRELIASGFSPEIKFFRPASPEAQHDFTRYNLYKDRLIKEKNDSRAEKHSG